MTIQEYNDIFKYGIAKKMNLEFSNNVVITNEQICSEEMSLEEALFSEERIRFGACESSQFKVRVVNNGTFKGETVVVSMLITDKNGRIITDNGDYLVDDSGNYIVYLPNTEFGLSLPYGTYKVISDEPSNDRMWRDLTCYDFMYDILNADVAEWYNALTFPMTIKDLRDSFFTYLGFVQETTTLVNDSLVVGGNFTVEGTLPGKTVIEAICELNGVFGHISRENKFEYITLPSQDTITYDWYVDGSGKYEDYEMEAITGVIARTESNDIGTSVGTDVNPYYITGNPLVYGLEGTAELTTALNNLLSIMSQVAYRPFEVETYGNPMIPVGTSIVINTKKYDPENGYSPFAINSFISRRVLNGIQALMDTFTTEGEQLQAEEVNSIKSGIKATRNRMHIIENDVDTFRSEITNIESIVAPIVNLSGSGTIYIYQTGDFLTDEEYENLIGTEKTLSWFDMKKYYPANKYSGKNTLVFQQNYVAALCTSDGTYWDLIKQRDVILTRLSTTSLQVNELETDTNFINFILEENVGFVLAIRLDRNITPTANGMTLELKLPNIAGETSSRTIIRPVYYQGEPLTASTQFENGQVLYLQYIEYSTISSEPNPYGFKYVWNILEDNILRSTSIIEQLSNEIVLKVDSNGRLAEVKLSADADSAASTLELTADNINFTSFNLNMTTTNFSLTSDGMTIDENGIELISQYRKTKITPNNFRIEDINDADTYTSLGINNLKLSTIKRVPGYNDPHVLTTQLGSDGITIYDEDLSEGLVIENVNIIKSSAWGGINTSLDDALSSLANVGNTQVSEPNAVSVANSTWTSLASITLPGGVWLIIGKARFASNATGRRGVRISTSASGSEVGQLAVDSETAISGSETHVTCMWITSNLSSATSFYLHGWQNSGSALSTLPRIKAVRIR